MSTALPLYEVPDAELMFRKVDPHWDREVLLKEQGWFPLADAMKTIDVHKVGQYRRVLAYREKLIRENLDWSRLMGLKHYGSRLWAHMPVFSLWYQANETLKINRIPQGWDLNTFLDQKSGIFSLCGVLRLFPEEWSLKYTTMKNLINQHQDPRREIGADKIEDTNYVVFMPKFGEWLRQHFN